jgi:uncharacterized protein YndB with AHSA1/START domain
VHIEQTFELTNSPECVFDYMTDPAKLHEWQTSKTRVEVMSEGGPRAGFRVREWTKVPGRKEFEQVVEFTRFERPTLLHTHIVEGPQPIDGKWSLSRSSGGTRIHFVAEGQLRGAMRVATPIVTLIIDRQFRKYHANLRRRLQSKSAKA